MVEINEDLLNANLFVMDVLHAWYKDIFDFSNIQQLPKILSKGEKHKVQVNIAISFSFQEIFITKGLMAFYENVSHMKRFHPSLMLVMRVLVII
jgi:hypothetical protein